MLKTSRRESSKKGLMLTGGIGGVLAIVLLASCKDGSSTTRVVNPGPGGNPLFGNNQPPMAQVVVDVTSGDAPLLVSFRADESFDPDGEGDVLSFTWDFGDASPVEFGETAVHTFAAPGQFLTVLTVRDEGGLSSVSEVVIDVSTQECPAFGSGVSADTVESSAIVEASGLVASRQNTDVLWINNDSGDVARVFALSISGTHLGTYNVQGAGAQDWEDISVGPGPEDGVDYLFIADIGDNARARSRVSIYRVPEPAVSAGQAPVTVTLTGAVKLEMTYPDGAWDAESMFVDPLTGDIFIISKRSDGRSQVYRNQAPHTAGVLPVMETVATLALGSSVTPGSTLATGADMSFDGRWILVRTYSHVFLWRRPSGGEVGQAFLGEVCRLSSLSEPQGEAIAFTANATGFFTVSEGLHQPLNFFDRTVAP